MAVYLRGSTSGAADLDAVIHSMPDAVYVGDERGVSACNDAALLMLGCERLSELEGGLTAIFERLQHRYPATGERVPPHEEPFTRALGGETVIEELVARHRQAGEDVILRCAAAPIHDGGSIVGAVVVNTDLTNSRWGDVFARTTLNSLSAHIAILDEKGWIVATNRAWQRFASSNPPTTPSTGPGTNYLQVCEAATGEGSEEALAFARGIREVISGRLETFELEYPCHSPDEKRWFVGRATRFPDTVPAKVVVAHENVTERRLAEEGMREVREAERRRMARDLHDGPLQDLTYALTAAQLVQSMTEDPNLKCWLERTTEALKRTGRELRTAVYDLRFEVESDKPFLQLVRSLVELNRRMAPDRHIRLEVTEDLPTHPLGRKDPELLHILQEALTNTRRHSGAENVSVSLGVEGGRIRAEVEDDGRGFDAGTVSGVGLKSMRERARTLGGTLKVDSGPGKGTRVRFTAATDRDYQGQTSLLLVEDHASFRDAATKVFEREPGFEVVGHAGSLAEARRMIDNGTPVADVAIIDLGLPDGYGGDLIKDLHGKNPQTQALVVSGNLDRAEVARAVESGAAGVLHKSVGMDDVVDAVRRVGAGEVLMPLEEVVDLLRLAGHQKEENREARQAVARLTPREIEVLRVLAEGLDGKEIANRLGISGKTERNHMASITEKLGVHSRLQALVFALKHGVVDPPGSNPQGY
jgi:DNA-binding NarL/FixJ family response regulator/signal transduction histidine kinase